MGDIQWDRENDAEDSVRYYVQDVLEDWEFSGFTNFHSLIRSVKHDCDQRYQELDRQVDDLQRQIDDLEDQKGQLENIERDEIVGFIEEFYDDTNVLLPPRPQ